MSPGQLGRWQWRGELERSMGWSGGGGEQWIQNRCQEMLFSIRNCSACGMGPGSAADAVMLDLLQELSDAGEVKKNRVSKGWASMAYWRYCPVFSYLECSQMCFELSFDISLQLQKENGKGMWSAFVACPEKKTILLLSAFLDCVELIGFVMWLCKHQSTGGFAFAPVAAGRWDVSCHSYVERSTLRSFSCSYRVHG